MKSVMFFLIALSTTLIKKNLLLLIFFFKSLYIFLCFLRDIEVSGPLVLQYLYIYMYIAFFLCCIDSFLTPSLKGWLGSTRLVQMHWNYFSLQYIVLFFTFKKSTMRVHSCKFFSVVFLRCNKVGNIFSTLVIFLNLNKKCILW